MADNENDKILVSTDRPVRKAGVTVKELDVGILATNVNLFLIQVEKMIEKTPETVGKFQFVEFEVHANVSADGKLVLMGSGVEAGIEGGLKFKFQKVQVPISRGEGSTP